MRTINFDLLTQKGSQISHTKGFRLFAYLKDESKNKVASAVELSIDPKRVNLLPLMIGDSRYNVFRTVSATSLLNRYACCVMTHCTARVTEAETGIRGL